MSTNVINAIDFTATLTDDDKQDIIYIIREAIGQLGSATAVANKCGVSDATISQIAKGQYVTKGDDMYRKIGSALGWRKTSYNVVETVTNTRIVLTALHDAQANSLFIGISEKAGAGKSTGIAKYKENNRAGNVFFLECWTWGPKEFLTRLRAQIGMPALTGTFTVNDMLEQIIHYFEVRKGKPLLIIDQANSLPHASLILFIHIYNRLRGKIGCVMAGTENLKVKIERGVRNNIHGYDELDDRLGRTYITLPGYLYSDVKKIAAANGITDEETIKRIWYECHPTQKKLQIADNQEQQIQVVESGRVIERKLFKYYMIAAVTDNQLSTAKIA